MYQPRRKTFSIFFISETLDCWDLIINTKHVYNHKTTFKKFNGHHSMFDSSKKNLIMLSQKLSTFETCLETKNKLKKIVLIIECVTHPENETSSCYLGNFWLLSLDSEENSCLQLKKSNLKSWNVWLVQKKLHHYAISKTIEMWDLILKI